MSKLISVEYLEESTEAIFFNVTIEVKKLFKKPENIIKRAFLEKWHMPNFSYANNFKWSDNTGSGMYDDAIVQEMILQYEKNNFKHQ